MGVTAVHGLPVSMRTEISEGRRRCFGALNRMRPKGLGSLCGPVDS